MAVNDRNSNNQNSQTDDLNRRQPPGEEPNLGAHGQGQGFNPNMRHGMNNLSGMYRRSGTFNLTDQRPAEVLNAFNTAIDRAKEMQYLSEVPKIIRFDKEQHRVAVSSLLVVKIATIQGVTFAAVRPILLESEGQRLKPRSIDAYGSNGRQRLELSRTMADVWSAPYWDAIVESLRASTGVTDLNVRQAGPLMLPASKDEFDLADENAVLSLLIDSTNRCDDVLEKIKGEAPFNVAEAKGPNDRVVARIDYNSEPMHSLTGLPIRSDITITMAAQDIKANQNEDIQDTDRLINGVSGFVTLEYSYQPGQQPQYGAFGQPVQQQPQPLFTPLFVITDVQQNTPMKTVELWLLSLSNAFRSTAQSAWANTFINTVDDTSDKNSVNKRDLGALTWLLPNDPHHTDVNAADFNIGAYLSALVHAQPAFVIDIDPLGENSLIESYLLDVALQTADAGNAQQMLINAANNLTNGEFAKIYDTSKPVAINYRQTINMGYYLSGDSKRDIRDLDLLAMLNIANGDLPAFWNWYGTYNNQTIDEGQRLHTRESIERNTLHRGLKLTSRAKRTMIAPEFLMALHQATEAAGLAVQMEHIQQFDSGQRVYANDMASQYVVSGGVQMSYGGPSMGAGSAYGYGQGVGSGRFY